MQPFLNEGRILFTDNFYASPSLAEHLLDNNTHLCKTVRTNCRNYCSEITWVNLDKGQSVFFFESTNHPGVLACKYSASKDEALNQQKVVYLPQHKYYLHQQKQQRQKLLNETGDCNQYIGGADCVDQQLNGIHI